MIAIVTGASRGIGQEFIRQLQLKGYAVFAGVRNPEQDFSQKAVEFLPLDVSQDHSVVSFAKAVSASKVDLLINNAGVIGDREINVVDTDSAAALEAFNVNVVGSLRVIRSFMPRLLKSNAPIIANISSLMGSMEDNASGGYYAYRMSKAALNMLTKNLSVEYPAIKSVSLHPGWVKTDMGGSGAQLEKTASVSGMLRVLENLKSEDSGKFFDYQGATLPW